MFDIFQVYVERFMWFFSDVSALTFYKKKEETRKVL